MSVAGEVEVQATRVFYENMECEAPIVFNRGGARSTKSYSLTQKFSTRLLECRKRKILVVRKTLPSLKLSIYRDFKEIWDIWGASSHIKEEKMGLDYYYKDNWLHFGSVDDPEKIKSTEWNDIFMEEANEFKLDDFQQLRIRMSAEVAKGDPPNQLTAGFNPVDAYHWLKEEVLEKIPGVVDIHSTFEDNPFLSPEYIALLKSLKQQDPNKWKIYGQGTWGALENTIYSNYEVVDDIPENVDEVFYGLDFGFNNPMSLIKISMIDNVPYEEELLYESGLTTADLIARLPELIDIYEDPIYADSAEPDRIEEIQRAGFNVMPANKSVNDGIDFVKTLPCKIKRDSVNLLKEIRGYSWKQDKNGRVLDDPVKYNDHLMDGRRYAYYSHLGDRTEFGIRWL